MLNLKTYKGRIKSAFETKPRNVLGICLGKNAAVAVFLGVEGLSKNLLGSFTVTGDQQHEQDLQHLTSLLADSCRQRNWQFSEVAVALDCATFMQHSVHSKFVDTRQIAATVRFDTEEALSTDVTELALAFRVISSSEAGSALTVFTARKKQLSDTLFALQSNGLDPVLCEPDIACLTRFIQQIVPLPEDSNSLYCLLTERNGYFAGFAKSHLLTAMRTFLIGPAQDRTLLLSREIPMTAALLRSEEQIDCVKIFDSTGQTDYNRLSKSLGIDTGPLDLASAAGVPSDCPDPVGFAVACGAALSAVQKEPSANFRSDFMPYQGRRLRMEKTAKFLSLSLVVLMIAAGLYFQMQLFQKNRYRAQLRQKLEKEYSMVVLGSKLEKGVDAVKKLSASLRRAKEAKSGQFNLSDQQSASAKLTLVLEAFNKCASQVHLNIESIVVAAKTITINGDTASRQDTLKLFEAVRNNKLEILQQRLDSKAGRDIFSISVVPKQ